MLVTTNQIPQTNSVESLNSGQAKRSRKAKNSALGIGVQKTDVQKTFAKLLAGLSRKTKAGGETAEAETEGLVSKEKIPRAAKDAVKTRVEFPEARILSAHNEKNQNKGRDLLSAFLNGDGEGLTRAERPKKKTAAKESQAGEAEEQVLLAGMAGELSPQELIKVEELLRDGTKGGEAADSADQDGLLRFAGTELRGRENARDLKTDNAGNSANAAENAAANALAGANRLSHGLRQNSGAEEKKSGPTTETRNSKKTRERFTLEVQDFRTGQNGAALPAGQEIKSTEAGAERVTDIVVELKSEGRNREAMELGREKTAGQAFEDILARELHQNLNGDIVRQASIMVRDGGEGTIRLSLKPESLGMVKIRLEMAENKITGHIIVESNEALRAFEREIHSLEQAFRDSGFDGASLDMALAQDGGQKGSQGQWDGDAGKPLYSSRIVSSNYDSAVETTETLNGMGAFDGMEGPGKSRVNVLV